MKILLIRPPYTLYKNALDYFTIPPAIGLGYLAQYLINKFYEVEILDTFALGWDQKYPHRNFKDFYRIGLRDEEIKERINAVEPDLIGITNPFTSQAHNMFAMADLCKSIKPSTPIVAGGVHPSSKPEECIANQNIDYIAVGEGENVLVELLRALENETDLSDLKSVYYRVNGDVKSNKLRNEVKNLDAIPFPAYHLLPMEHYFKAARHDYT